MTRMKRNIVIALALATLVLYPVLSAPRSDDPKYSSQRLKKTETLDDIKSLLINGLLTYFSNDGSGGHNPGDENSLVIKQNGGLLMYTEGLIWGGYQRSVPKMGGAYWVSGLQAGPIVTPGTSSQRPVAADRTNTHYRVYRVRPDISSSVPSDLAAAMLAKDELPWTSGYEPITGLQLFANYCRDWNEWPGAEGAPYTDVNNNGVYEPAIDIPGVPGADQTLWYVCNDMDSLRTTWIAGLLPAGLEMQKTLWAYNRPGALNTTIFQRSRLLNKSGLPIDSMYVAQFSDPDIGGRNGYYNNYTGCDTIRNMGFAYFDATTLGYFGSQPPAIGFAILAGPTVPGSAADSAFVNFSYRKGMKNLPMTSMVMVRRFGDEPYVAAYTQGREFYNVLKGLSRTGTPIVNPQTGRATNFVFPGDPVTQSGWVEGTPYFTSGEILPSADRRLQLTSGPFTMAPADTQDILLAEIVGMGFDNLGSVAALQSNADAVRKIFRNGFRLPATPPAPSVHVSQLDGHILLDWTEAASAARTESYASEHYRFEGYNVYQLPGGDAAKAKRIATFDIVDNVQSVTDTLYDAAANMNLPVRTAFGKDSGIQRFYYTGSDSLTGARMVNGRTYDYAVTSYAYDPKGTGGTKIIESRPVVLEAIPQAPLPGTAVHVQFGQILSDDPSRVRSAGMKDRSVLVRVIDPAKVAGHTYAVVFSDTGAHASWSVFDSTANTMVIRDQKNYTKVLTYYNYPKYFNDPADPVVDGLQFSVVVPPVVLVHRWSLSTSHLERTYSADQAAADVQRINVYPNPYFADNALETNKYEHFVTFNHLPQKAVINILTLTGVRLRVLVKDDPSQFLKWDLTNENGAQVAAGMYVVYISLPELGTQKILKLAVIPAVTIPDHW